MRGRRGQVKCTFVGGVRYERTKARLDRFCEVVTYTQVLSRRSKKPSRGRNVVAIAAKRFGEKVYSFLVGANAAGRTIRSRAS